MSEKYFSKSKSDSEEGILDEYVGDLADELILEVDGKNLVIILRRNKDALKFRRPITPFIKTLLDMKDEDIESKVDI